MSEVTLLLKAAKAGNPEADERLWQVVYEELRRMASALMAQEHREVTLSGTALLHEAWLRLTGPEGAALEWDSRRHFFSAAAEAMRRILVDQARARLRQKRGGGSTVDVPDLPGNVAWLRLGPGGPWAMGAPPPGRPNAAALDISIQPGDTSLQARVLFPTKAGKQFTLQSSTRLTGGWVPLIQGTGEGFERLWQEPVSGPQRYFRVQENP